jgi:hypothetical protein
LDSDSTLVDHGDDLSSYGVGSFQGSGCQKAPRTQNETTKEVCMAFFQVDKMTHNFGGLRAVHNYHLEIELGQIKGLIGPNARANHDFQSLYRRLYPD